MESLSSSISERDYYNVTKQTTNHLLRAYSNAIRAGFPLALTTENKELTDLTFKPNSHHMSDSTYFGCLLESNQRSFKKYIHNSLEENRGIINNPVLKKLRKKFSKSPLASQENFEVLTAGYNTGSLFALYLTMMSKGLERKLGVGFSDSDCIKYLNVLSTLRIDSEFDKNLLFKSTGVKVFDSYFLEPHTVRTNGFFTFEGLDIKRFQSLKGDFPPLRGCPARGEAMILVYNIAKLIYEKYFEPNSEEIIQKIKNSFMFEGDSFLPLYTGDLLVS